jgi:carboxymethylenebutenolidase
MQSTFRSGGRDIRIDIHEPTTPSAHPAIILMHGAGGNVGLWLDRLAPLLSSAGIALYAPHYFDRTNTVRADLAAITDGVHVPQWLSTLDAALTFAAGRPGVDPARIAVIGISLGAFLSLAFAAELSASPDPAARRRVRTLVDLSGGLIDSYAGRATRDFPPTLILHGEADNIVPVTHARALDKLLTALNVKHETRLLPNEGHWFSGAAQMQLLLAVAGFLSKNL